MNIITKSKEECEKEAVVFFTEKVNQFVAEKDEVVLGIPGGSSVKGFFSLLKEYSLPWEKIHIFLVDERFVFMASEENNFRIAQEAFVNPLQEDEKLPEKNVHPFMYDPDEKDGGVKLYKKQFSPYERFDIIILGIGEDGHVASLFPNHPSVQDNGRTFVVVEDSPKPPPRRMSASRRLLEKAKVSFLFVFGDNKKEALQKLNDDSLSVEQCPARLIKKNKESYVFTDQS